MWRVVASLWKLSSEMAGSAVQAGVCWPDAGTCHTAARTNNALKGEKIHNTLKGEEARQACNFGGWQKDQFLQRRQQDGDQQITLAPSSPALPLHPKWCLVQQLLQVAFGWPLTHPDQLLPSHLSTHSETGWTWIKSIHSYKKESKSAQGCWGQLWRLARRTGHRRWDLLAVLTACRITWMWVIQR